MKFCNSVFFWIHMSAVFLTVPSIASSTFEPEKDKLEYIDQDLNKKFDNISRLISETGESIGVLLQKKEIERRYPNSTYAQLSGSYITDRHHFGLSNFFIPNRPPLNKKQLDFLIRTEAIEEKFIQNGNKYRFLGWQYIIHIDTLAMRVVPWVNPANVVIKDIEFPKFQFFKNAVKIPVSRNVICNSPVNDTGGLGDIITCTKMIFKSSRPFAILGFDLKLGELFGDLVPQLGNINNFYIFVERSRGETIFAKPKFMDIELKKNFDLKDFDRVTFGSQQLLKFKERVYEFKEYQYDWYGLKFKLVHLKKVKTNNE